MDLNVLLLYPLGERYAKADNRMPTLAIYRLAAVLREQGHAASVADIDIHDQDVGELLSGIDLVGISANTFNWPAAHNLSLQVRQCDPEVPIVLGGIHPRLFDEHCLIAAKANFVIRGEGERALPALVEAVAGKKKLTEVSALTWIEDGVVQRTQSGPLLTVNELEQLPLPAYDLIPPGRYQAAPVETSRGCNYCCTFCSVPYRASWRGISAEQAVTVIEHAVQHGDRFLAPGAVYVLDDCFTTCSDRTIRILDQLAGSPVRIGLEARADQLTVPVVQALAGCDMWLIQIGVECGYDEGLKKVSKRITLSDVERSAELLREYGLQEQASFSFVVGLPWETVDDCVSTVSFAAYLGMKFRVGVSIHWYEPFPGSQIWKHRQQFDASGDATMFDGPGDWRDDPDVFQLWRPRLSRDDCRSIEELIAGYAIIVPRDLALFEHRRWLSM